MTTENVLINIREDGARVVVVNITAIANASAHAESTVNGLRRALAGFSLAYLTREFFQAADAINMMDSRLRLVTKSTQEFTDSQKEIYRISQQNNVGLMETTKLYTRLVDPIKLMGGSMKEVAGISDAFASALRAQGVSTAESAAATIQFSQAMNKGKLDGDEFRTMAETAPRVMRAFADGMGVAYGSLKTLSIQGKLTSDVLSNALLKQLKELKEEASKVGDTVGGAMSDLKNDTMLAVGAFDRMTGTSRMTADAISGVSLIVFELANVFRDELKDGAKDVNKEFDTMSLVIRVIGTVLESAIVLASDVAHIFKTLGRNIGGFAAQVQAGLSGNWSAIADIQADLTAQNESGLKELERYQTRILGITDRALAARQKLKDGTGANATDYNFSKLESVASEDKLIETRMRLAGITKNYYEDLNNLQSAYDSGKMSLKEYTGALGELAKKTWENSAAGKVEKNALKDRGNDDRLKNMQNALSVQKGIFEKEEQLFSDRTEMLSFYNSKLGMSDDEYYENKQTVRQEYLAAITSSFAREKEIIESFKPKNAEEVAAQKGRLIKLGQEEAKYFAQVDKMRGKDLLDRMATSDKIRSDDEDRQSEYLASEYETLEALRKSNNLRVASAVTISKETEALLRQAIAKQELTNLEPNRTPAENSSGQAIIDMLTAQLNVREQITEELMKQRKLSLEDQNAKNLIASWRNLGKEVADSLKDSFGKVGESVGGVFETISNNMADQLELAFKLDKATKGMDKDDPERYKLISEAREKSSQMQIRAYGDMAGAAKGFFKENSTGYKVLEATEKAFRIFELTMAVTTMAKKLLVEKASTSASMVNAGKEASSWGVTAVVKAIASMPYPYNIAAGAATAAAIIGLGVKLNSGISASGVTAEKQQSIQGTGSVLGDKSAKSESIANTIEKLANSSNELVPINQGMLSALKNIETSIAGVGNIIARTNGIANGTNMGIKTGQINEIGSPTDTISKVMTSVTKVLFLGFGDKIASFINNLWGKVTQKIVDSGIQFGGSLRGLQQGEGFNQYANVETTKSSFFGIVKKTTPSTKIESLDEDLTEQFGMIFKNAEKVLIETGKTLGIRAEDVAKTLDALTIDKTNLSLNGLKGDDLTNAIMSVISKGLDQMAQAVFPELEDFRKVGEGFAETAMRLASNSAIVDAELSKIGGTFGAVGISSIKAREDFLELAGGVDTFSSDMSKFSKTFLTETEQLAPVSKYVSEEMSRLGFAGVKTRDQFKEAVMGLAKSGALATESGMKTFTGLLAVSDAFAQVTPVIKATGDSSYKAADILDERNTLQDKYNELTMTTVDLEKEREKKVHSSNLELYRSVVIAGKVEEETKKLNDLNKNYDDQIKAVKVSMLTGKDAIDAATIGMDNSTRSRYEELESLKDQKAAQDKLAQTNKEWTDKIDDLYKASLPLNEQRKLEVKGMDKSTLALYERYEALTEEARVLDVMVSKYKDLGSVMQASVKLAEDVAKGWMDSVTASVEKDKKALQKGYDDLMADFDDREKALKKTYNDEVKVITKAKNDAKTAYDLAQKALDTEKKDAISSYKTAVDDLKATEKAALTAYKDAVKALGTEKDLAVKAYQESIKSISALIKASSDKVNSIGKLVDTLNSTLDAMRQPGTEGAYRQQAQSQIKGFLAVAKAGGSLPEQEQISSALQTVSASSQDLFSSFTDYEYDFERTAAEIRELNEIAGGQLLQAQTELSVLESTKLLMETQHEELLAKFDLQREALDVANELRAEAFDKQLEAMAAAQEALLASFDTRKEALDIDYDKITSGFEAKLTTLAEVLEANLSDIDKERDKAKEYLDDQIAKLDESLELARKQYETQLGIYKAVMPLDESVKGLGVALGNLKTAQGNVGNPVNMSQADAFALAIVSKVQEAGGLQKVNEDNAKLIAMVAPSLQEISRANQLYVQVLGRNAEGNSAQALAAMIKGGMSEDAAIASLKGSKEYEARQISVDLQKQVNQLVNAILNTGITNSMFVDGSHANGLKRVPFDGYIAQLHRDERVLTAPEARSMDMANSSNSNDSESAFVQKFGEYMKDRNIADATIIAQTTKTREAVEKMNRTTTATAEEA